MAAAGQAKRVARSKPPWTTEAKREIAEVQTRAEQLFQYKARLRQEKGLPVDTLLAPAEVYEWIDAEAYRYAPLLPAPAKLEAWLSDLGSRAYRLFRSL